MKSLIISFCFLFSGCWAYNEISPELAVKDKELCIKGGMDYEVVLTPQGRMSRINCVHKK